MSLTTDDQGNKLYGFSVHDMQQNTEQLKVLTTWTKRFFFAVVVFGLIALAVLVYFIVKYPIFARLVNILISRAGY